MLQATYYGLNEDALPEDCTPQEYCKRFLKEQPHLEALFKNKKKKQKDFSQKAILSRYLFDNFVRINRPPSEVSCSVPPERKDTAKKKKKKVRGGSLQTPQKGRKKRRVRWKVPSTDDEVSEASDSDDEDYQPPPSRAKKLSRPR